MAFLAPSMYAFAPTPDLKGIDCKPDGTVLKLKWNQFASELGLYEVDGCAGVSPKLHLQAGVTYTFDQSDASNWYHPVGFSYVAGGAHAECKGTGEDGGPGECPELGGEEGGSTLLYYVDGAPVTSDDSGFGLDAYEPLFFNSQDWWGEQSPFKVTLTIPADASYTRVYYFCHIHAGMSAEIEVYGSTAKETTILAADQLFGESETSALQIYADIVASMQPKLSTFDKACGTYDSATFDADHSTCADKHFLCGDGADGMYGRCLKSIDCQMHHAMAVSVEPSTSKFATFARQMIAHHKNAVDMAKVLAKFMTPKDFPPAGTEDQDMDWANGLISSIINVQNHQIQSMQGWLDANPKLAGASELCYE